MSEEYGSGKCQQALGIMGEKLEYVIMQIQPGAHYSSEGTSPAASFSCLLL